MNVNYAELIKERISMKDVCDKYGIRVNRINKAICPFHPDKNPSMHVYPGKRGFFCFVCGTHGDVIDFVSKYFQLPFRESLKRIDSDFQLNLGIGEELTEEQIAEQKRIQYKRRKQRDLEKKTHKELEDEFFNAVAKLHDVESRIMDNSPLSDSDPDAEFWSAVSELPSAKEKLEIAEMNLIEFERKHKSV